MTFKIALGRHRAQARSRFVEVNRVPLVPEFGNTKLTEFGNHSLLEFGNHGARIRKPLQPVVDLQRPRIRQPVLPEFGYHPSRIRQYYVPEFENLVLSLHLEQLGFLHQMKYVK